MQVKYALSRINDVISHHITINWCVCRTNKNVEEGEAFRGMSDRGHG